MATPRSGRGLQAFQEAPLGAAKLSGSLTEIGVHRCAAGVARCTTVRACVENLAALSGRATWFQQRCKLAILLRQASGNQRARGSAVSKPLRSDLYRRSDQSDGQHHLLGD